MEKLQLNHNVSLETIGPLKCKKRRHNWCLKLIVYAIAMDMNLKIVINLILYLLFGKAFTENHNLCMNPLLLCTNNNRCPWKCDWF